MALACVCGYVDCNRRRRGIGAGDMLSMLPFPFAPLLIGLIFGFLCRAFLLNLVDEVWDAGEVIIVRNKGCEEMIALSDFDAVENSRFVTRRELRCGFCAIRRSEPRSTSCLHCNSCGLGRLSLSRDCNRGSKRRKTRLKKNFHHERICRPTVACLVRMVHHRIGLGVFNGRSGRRNGKTPAPPAQHLGQAFPAARCAGLAADGL